MVAPLTIAHPGGSQPILAVQLMDDVAHPGGSTVGSHPDGTRNAVEVVVSARRHHLCGGYLEAAAVGGHHHRHGTGSTALAVLALARGTLVILE